MPDKPDKSKLIIERLEKHIERIERHQKALGLADAPFCQRYARYLGSAKTWRDRMCKRQFEELGGKLEHWTRKLGTMVDELDGRSHFENFILEMPFAVKMTSIFNQLQAQRTDRRCGVGLGITGVGKSVWARYIVNQNPREAIYVRANENWRDSKTQIAQGLAAALSCWTEGMRSAASMLGKVIETLKRNPQTIIIDEAHEGGTMLLKLVKTLIDETNSKFVLLAYPTSWNKMLAATDDARAEAQQLFGRTLKPVFADYAYGIKRSDIVTFLRESAPEINGEADGVAGTILAMVRTNGNLRLLADAVERAQIQADATGTTMTGELIVEHVKALCPIGKGAE